MELSEQNFRVNFRAFLWHSAFLAFAANFMDVNTIIPSMLIKVGSTPILLGLLTAILLGGSSVSQILFAGFLLNKSFKKKYLLIGINIRIVALLGLALMFYKAFLLSNNWIIFLIFILISAFSFSGAFAGVSYTDILGKVIKKNERKIFFTTRQIFNSVGILISALIVRKLLKYYNFPLNYSIIFLFAGILILIASLGFWKIREVNSNIKEKKGLLKFLKLIPSEIKNNPNLKYYLLIINTLGFGLSIIPFLVLIAQRNFGLSYDLIGNFLLFNTFGMLLAGLFLFKYSKKFTYKTLLKYSIFIAASLPIAALALSKIQFAYQFIFILSGIFITIYHVAINGLLLEISNKENRITYTGISGTGNIVILLFPVLAGFLISTLGYSKVFIAVSIIILFGYAFVEKLQCKIKSGQDL